MKRFAPFVPVFLFVSVVVALAFSLRSDVRKMPAMLIDRPAPAFKLPPLEAGGKGLSSADFGGKVVLLNVFASWCPVCKQEHPALLQLANNADLPLYGINWKDQPGKGAEWLRLERNPYARIGEDADGHAGDGLGVTGVPETFVIDATGRIRYRHAGPITPDIWRKVFEPLLAHIKTERGG